MRRLFLAAVLALVPAAPASAGPAACVAANGFPVCAGTCSFGENVSVRAVGTSGSQAVASCGGVEARCTIFLAPTCTATARATSSGPLTCGGSADVVVCSVSVAAQ